MTSRVTCSLSMGSHPIRFTCTREEFCRKMDSVGYFFATHMNNVPFISYGQCVSLSEGNRIDSLLELGAETR